MPATPSARLGLSRSYRIKQSRDFSRARTAGSRLVHGCLVMNWVSYEALSHPRLGVITSKKLGNAVVRSRARRLLREAFRLHQHELRKPVDLVLVARSSITRKPFPEVERDLLHALQQARLLKGPS